MIIRIVLLIMLLASPAYAAVLMETNFDSDADFTVTQPTSGATICTSGCGMPSPWNAYRSGMSYCTGGPGNNNFYIKTGAGATTASNGAYACASGSKCLTFWDESCTNDFEDSDGMLSYDLGAEYSDVYVRFKIKFGYKTSGARYEFRTTEPAQHKFTHVQHYVGGSLYEYLSNDTDGSNSPVVVGGMIFFAPSDFLVCADERCNCGSNTTCYYCNSGSPSYTYDGTNQDFTSLGGSFLTTLGDNNWHTIQMRHRMNTYSGGAFQSNGIFEYWVDGVRLINKTNIPYNKSGAETSPVRGWRWVSIGGNVLNRWTSSCTGTGCEQWYAVDDVVISTTFVPEDYVIGGSDTTAPVISGGLPTTTQKCTTAPTSVTLQATTDENATCKYSTTDVAYASMANTFFTTGTTSHSQSLSLGCGLSYTYYVRCIDGSDNANTSSTAINFSVEKKTIFRR